MFGFEKASTLTGESLAGRKTGVDDGPFDDAPGNTVQSKLLLNKQDANW